MLFGEVEAVDAVEKWTFFLEMNQEEVVEYTSMEILSGDLGLNVMIICTHVIGSSMIMALILPSRAIKFAACVMNSYA